MATHCLKTELKFFNDICYHGKSFEVRKNDRNFKKGDTLILQAINENKDLTGQALTLKIRYILKDSDFPKGIKKGYCVLSIF